MRQFTVTGMSCAACAARVEKAVLQLPGVESCTVSLLTNSMGVEGSAKDCDIVRAVTEAGYGAKAKKSEESSAQNMDEALQDQETPRVKKRLAASAFLLLILMYVSMGHGMFGFPLPAFFAENYVALGILELLLAQMILTINQSFFIRGFSSAIHLAPNMDTLVALGSGVSFLYSVWVLFAMTATQEASAYVHELYFETAAMIVTLLTVGKMLEARSKGKTTDALKSLVKLAPKTATILRDREEMLIPAEQVNKGDIFVLRPGETIPVDGIVLEGNSAVNEAALTGESIPVDKKPGDGVSAATINQSGYLRCEAVRVGQDTTLSQIIQMVSDAAATKAPIAKIADRVAGIFVPVVLAIALVTVIAWLLAGETVGNALAFGIAVLVISCPCSLGLATPVAIMVGNGIGARNGILFKTAASLEEMGRVQIVALDKTGTITKGEPKVTDLLAVKGTSRQELLEYAVALEKGSEHPLARAIIAAAKEQKVTCRKVEDFQALPGNGVSAKWEGHMLYGGSLQWMRNKAMISKQVENQAQKLAEQGKTPIFFAKDNELLGMIAVADVMKEDSPQAIRQLQSMGIRVVMLTGDNERTAKAIGMQAGVDEVIADVLPEGKEAVIRNMQTHGKVAMVGDGINDAPALTRADIGIAIGAGTDVAIDAADVVLMKSRLLDVAAAIRLSRATLRNIHENLFWAFFYNSVGIPIAAGVFAGAWGWKLNPMLGAAAMSLSSICVVTNALRLNRLSVHDASNDKKGNHTMIQERIWNREKRKENKGMTKTMKIEGMMCAHCEARVKEALEAIDGVCEADVSHTTGSAVVTMTKNIADEVLSTAVERERYTVTKILSE